MLCCHKKQKEQSPFLALVILQLAGNPVWMFYLSGTRMTCEICAFDKCTKIFGEVHEKDAL